MMITQEQPAVRQAKPSLFAWKRRLWMLSKSPLTLLGAAIITLMLGLMVFSPWIVPHDPNAISLTDRLQPPSAAHWFGTDEVGRDLFSRVLAAVSWWGASSRSQQGWRSCCWLA